MLYGPLCCLLASIFLAEAQLRTRGNRFVSGWWNGGDVENAYSGSLKLQRFKNFVAVGFWVFEPPPLQNKKKK